MPFTTNVDPCKKCGIVSTNHRVKNGYVQSTCKLCERLSLKLWIEENKSKWAEYQQRQYIKNNGPITRNMNHTKDSKAQWNRDKANKICTRAKQARFYDELTTFVYLEAHELRKLRNKLFTFEWHVDHIIPLVHNLVCGLHISNNFAVIPKVDNLRKGNYYSIHH